MIRITALQRQNLLSAKEMWESVPKENVYPGLDFWRTKHQKHKAPDCNTIACFGGWCAWWPAFRDQGITENSNGMPMFASGADVSSKLFGNSYMFDVRSAFIAGSVSDWQVVMDRIDKHINNTVVPDVTSKLDRYTLKMYEQYRE